MKEIEIIGGNIVLHGTCNEITYAFPINTLELTEKITSKGKRLTFVRRVGCDVNADIRVVEPMANILHFIEQYKKCKPNKKRYYMTYAIPFDLDTLVCWGDFPGGVAFDIKLEDIPKGSQITLIE